MSYVRNAQEKANFTKLIDTNQKKCDYPQNKIVFFDSFKIEPEEEPMRP